MNNELNFETMRLNPRRVYECPNCKRICARKDVRKTEGEFYCKVCGGRVIDKTNTETGHDFMEIVLI